MVIAKRKEEDDIRNYTKSCEYNIDSGRVEVKFSNGAIMSIDCTTVEDEFADNIHQRSELDYLIYNKPAEYGHGTAVTGVILEYTS